MEGAFKVWIREQSVNYFILRGDPLPVPEDDQDIDGNKSLCSIVFFQDVRYDFICSGGNQFLGGFIQLVINVY